MVRWLKRAALLLLLVGNGWVSAQMVTTPVRYKRTVWIPKVDVFWSTVVVADGFPTFFPLELEIHIPRINLSVEPIFSPWFRTFSTQTQTTDQASVIGGLGLRYYLKGKSNSASAQGFFIEPQFFLRWERTSVDLIVIPEPEVSTTWDTGLFLAGGYQREFFDKLYIQGRLSVGYADTSILETWRSGKFAILPWVGVGFRLN